MSVKKSLTNRLKTSVFAVLFAILSIFGIATSINILTSSVNPVYAEPQNSDVTNNSDTTENSSNTPENNTTTDATNTSENTDNVETCYDQVGALAWFICPGTGVLSKAIDGIYSQIEKILVVNPISTDGTSPIFQIWQIMRDITNVIFVIILLISIYSQITGLGISNYGLKKALPKLVVAAVLVNLSYIICAIGVDVSNIVGANLHGLFENIQLQAINIGGAAEASRITWTQLTGALIGGGAIAGLGIAVAGGLGALLWPLLGALLIGVISVLIGLLTLGLRHALISILIMIAPLAIVCYLLPNTEKWFTKWKDIFISMLIFYPMFSLLFGASQLAGWALIATSVQNGSLFGVVVGMAVQVLPLFLSISLMKMSGTILGKVSSGLDKLTSKPRDAIRAATGYQRELSKLRHINNSVAPSAHLQRFMDKRNRKEEIDFENETRRRRARAEIWAQRAISGSQKYEPGYLDEYATGKDKNGNPSKRRLQSTMSTRAAKDAMNLELAAQAATKDTSHILQQYGSYHHSSAQDKALSSTGAKNYLNLYRANLAEENDAFSDEDFVIGRYNEFRDAFQTDQDGNLKYDSSGQLIPKSADALKDYNHYIVGAAGALGERGELTVLGEVIARSAANEAKRKAYTNYFHSKYGFNKREFRNMITGFANDDDGFAVDRITGERLYVHKKDQNGNYILDESGEKKKFYERVPGEFLQFHPEVIAKYSAYNQYDIDPATGNKLYYYNATDKDGHFLAKVYKSDTPAMKEILSNWDMNINDPINTLYGILAGNPQGTFASVGLDGVGFGNLSTTIQRAIQSYKEKDSSVGPMFATSVGLGHVTNSTQSLIESLDNYMKTGKPGSFNIQDAATFGRLSHIINPDDWEDLLFDEAALRSRLNVNGSHLKGIALAKDSNGNYLLDANGKPTITRKDIPVQDATREELINGVISKFFNGNFGKWVNMMSRITPNTIDNQKPTTQEAWNNIYSGLLAMSEIAEENNLIPDEFPIDEENMTKEEIAEAEKKNQAAKEKRRKWRKELFTRYPLLKDPLEGLGNDTIQNANRLRKFTRQLNNRDSGHSRSQALSKRMRESTERANTGMSSDGNSSYYNPDALAREAAIMNQGWDDDYNSTSNNSANDTDYGHSFDNSHNYMVRLDLLAAEHADSPEMFCEAAISYLESELPSNPRLEVVLDEFQEMLEQHRYDTTYTTDRFRDYLFDWLPLADNDD